MKNMVRMICFLMALMLFMLPPLQVSADVAYYPGEPGGGSGRDTRQEEKEEWFFQILTIVLWIIALIAVTCALLLWLKRK